MKPRPARAWWAKSLTRGDTLVGRAVARLARNPTLARWRRQLRFPGSAPYWEERYRAGRTSGAGSYGVLAAFKAEILNDFVRANGVRSVIELGCGDGAQLGLADYPLYVGLDVSKVAVALCRQRFADDDTKRFYLMDAAPASMGTFDLALSMDVIYHLVEDVVFDTYMRALFARSHGHVVIYASNRDQRTETPHVRHRQFTRWIARFATDWEPAGFVANRHPFDPERPDETSFADFHVFARRIR